MSNGIPPMTHPLSRQWDQPDVSGFLIDATHCVLLRKDWEELTAYDSSIPSGVYDGKVWRTSMKRLAVHNFCTDYVRWYGPSDDPDRCSIHTRLALVIT